MRHAIGRPALLVLSVAVLAACSASVSVGDSAVSADEVEAGGTARAGRVRCRGLLPDPMRALRR